VKEISSLDREFKNDLLENGISAIRINTIEVTGVVSPSDITIRLESDGQIYFFPFHAARCKFLYQNGVFILDTCATENLIFSINDFSVQVMYEKSFDLSMYCVGVKDLESAQ